MSAVNIRSDEITPYLERLNTEHVARFLIESRPQVAEAAAQGIRSAYGASNFPFSKTGNLFRSIGWRPLAAKGLYGFVAGPLGRKGSHRHLVEFGTSPHYTYPVDKQAMAWNDRSGRRRFSRVAVFHPGAKPNPWFGAGRPTVIAAVQRTFDALVKEKLT